MKIDEVMLGDIVSVSGRPIHVTLAVLNNWSDSIEPIPLTPEILEKNGFEHIKQKVIIPSKSQEEVEVEYMYCKELPCSFDIIHGYLMFNSNIDLCSIRMVVNYVHELQHLLKLCGIDKEIVV
jgi:hypothetical protein